MVLCGGADECDTTDINLLDCFRDGDVDLGDSILEGVEVADDIVDLVNVLLGKILLVRSQVAGEDASVDRRVESLDTASKHLRCLGDCRDISIEGRQKVSLLTAATEQAHAER